MICQGIFGQRHVPPNFEVLPARQQRGERIAFYVMWPKECVVVHAPGYQALYEIAAAIGCNVTLWLTAEAEAKGPK